MPGDNDTLYRLRAAYAAWHGSRGQDFDTWIDLCAEDIALGSLLRGRPGAEFTAPKRGKAGVRQYLAGLLAEWEMLHFHTEEFIAAGDRVVMLGQCAFRHRKTGKRVDTPKADIWRFRGGKAVEFFEFYDSAAVLAAAG
jgi:ketosteroid isomerase-like protein